MCRVQELLAQAEQLVPDGDLPALQVRGAAATLGRAVLLVDG